MTFALAEPATPVIPGAAAPWYLYVAFLGFVLAMLFIDLKLFHTETKQPTAKESGGWVAVWVGLAIIFGIVVAFWKGSEKALEYFSGYLVEYSLSVDNIFVFIIIFSYFKIPREYQHQVLFYGILGAMIFRGIFIALGVGLVNRFEWILYVFGALLVWTAVRVALGMNDVSPEDNKVLKFFQKRFRTTTSFHGKKLFVSENGRRVATPLFVVLLIIETTDIFFAIDSIPAIFGLTRDPFIILTSNVFAILGLRALYFLLAESLNRLHLLQYGLALILGFVGVKMLLSNFVHLESWMSLLFIVTALVVTAAASLMTTPRLPEGFSPEDEKLVDPSD